MLRFSIALLAMHEAEILAINSDASQLYDLLDNMASQVYNVDKLLEATKRIDFKPGQPINVFETLVLIRYGVGVVNALRIHHGILVDREILVHSTTRTLGTLHLSEQTHFNILELAHLSAHFEYMTAKDHAPGLLALPRHQYYPVPRPGITDRFAGFRSCC